MLLRRFLIVGSFLLLAWRTEAQVGNEWIKFNQSYFKIAVARDGLYKLSYSNLQNAGFPVDEVDPRRLQLFHRGVEQSIYVEGEADAIFHPADFLEFYGRRNDGTLDAELYQPASAQPHSYYNLYNDTTSYFLKYDPLVAGKRMDFFQEVNSTNISNETHHTDEKLLVLSDGYATGIAYDKYFQNTFFDQAEGWTGVELRQNEFIDYTLSNIVQGVSAQGAPKVEVMLLGMGDMAHQSEIWIGQNSSSLRLLGTQNFIAYTTSVFSQAIDWADIGADGKLTIRIKALGVGGADRLSAAYIRLTYPQSFDVDSTTEKFFQLEENVTNKSYIEIVNPPTGLRLFDVTDPDNVSRIGTNPLPILNAVVSATITSRKILATGITNTPASVKQINFRQIDPSQHDYIIISNRLLMQPASGYSNPVKAYADYRGSTVGGGYDTLVVDVDQLYNQFNYGEISPLAIRHFMKFMINSGAPKYLFIIGKGLDVNYKYYRKPSFYSTYKDLVPTAGMPASDIYYTSGLSGTTIEPAVPTGRITASSAVDVAAYLNKVKEMEALPFNELWRKDILHLSGGIATGEPEEFRQYMEDFQSVAESYHLGGKVTAIAKRTTEIKLINIKDQVNAGLNLVTFFGHSSVKTTDFDIGFVTDPALEYNNPGKYPMMLINGCNAGAFFLNGKMFGEDWINASGKGATGCIAHTSFGFSNNLKRYSDTFYEVGYGDSTFIHQGIGDIQKEVARRYIAASPPASVYDITQAQQMLLLGDPAVKLFGAKKADYEVNDNNLFMESFDGNPVTALSDSFGISVIVRNFGQAKEDSIRVELVRTFNDNSTATYSMLTPSIFYSDTLLFVIKKGRTNGFGNNTFTVTIDSDSTTAELNEGNNGATRTFFIPLNSTKNLLPREYGIVNSNTVTLTFQSTDLLSGERDFLVEVDTIDTFNSPFKKQFIVKGAVLAKQALTLLTQDTLAYYWRTKFAQPLSGESEEWTTSSFTFINNGPEGWAQVHFPQYLKNEVVGLVRDEDNRQLRFVETRTSIFVKTFGANNPATNTAVSVKIDNAEYNLSTQGQPCRANTINLVAFDKITTVPYPAIPFLFRDPRTCGREPQVIVSFTLAEIETGIGDDIIQYINNVALGDSVVIFNIGDAGYSSWSSTVKNKFGELGISVAQIDALQNGEPVVIFGRKGASPGSAIFYRTSTSPANQQELQVNGTITGRYTSGEMSSVLIGPAQNWQEFIKQNSEAEPGDEISFDIIGVNLKGTEEVLQSNVTTDLDLTNINATDYPYLKVVFKAKDDLNLTASQLNKWLVLYESVAEGVLVFKGPHEQQLLEEGQDWIGRFGFVNISDKIFPDSLTVQYEVFTKTARTSWMKQINIKAPAPSDTSDFSFIVNTEAKIGLNDINVYVNPRIVPEQYYENNVLNMADYLYVQNDVFKPVLDVTIDGRHVLNGDYVSPNPTILIKLWDENKIVLKTDTIGMNLLLTFPCESTECNPEKIYFSRNDVQWVPATDTSVFKIEFEPQYLPEGEYTLWVSASDGKGNVSGVDPYEITFLVKYESSVEILSPHPNPSNSIFIFTMVISGSELPEYFMLQVINVEGKILREFNVDGGTFHIGTNNLYWDGKNSSGYDMPGGVYIYRLRLKTGDHEIQKNGKLVLVR